MKIGWLRILDLLVSAAALSLVGLVVYASLAEPFSTGRVVLHMLFLPSATVLIHRGLAWYQRGLPPSWQKKATAVFKWLGSPILAMILSGVLEMVTLGQAMRVVERDLTPVTQAVAADPKPRADILDLLANARGVHHVTYFPKDAYFVLSTAGGSIDMDGETIFYDSRRKQWQRFHRDLHDSEEARAFGAALETPGGPAVRYRKQPDEAWKRLDADMP